MLVLTRMTGPEYAEKDGDGGKENITSLIIFFDSSKIEKTTNLRHT